MQVPVITLTRKQLYDEIWELSAVKIASKYDIPYSKFLTQVKAAKIPTPPSGYWTKLEFGKPVEKIDLLGSFEEPVNLYKDFTIIRETKTLPKISEKERKLDVMQKEKTAAASVKRQEPEKTDVEEKQCIKPESLNAEPETIKEYGQVYNVYDRETLYNEVWAAPVTEVAKKYKVSDVAIHKICRSLDIPTPPIGYWAKLRAGKKVVKASLPRSDKDAKKKGTQTGYIPLGAQEAESALGFLSEEDRAVILAVASQILIPDDKEIMHSAIVAHRKAIAEWNKTEANREYTRWQRGNAPPAPALVGRVSDESIPRACHIIDALIKATEPLGCKLTDQLNFIVNGETVGVTFSESQDKVNHELTREENRQLLLYEERRKKYSYESKPQIRKYDSVYNGRLSLTIDNQKAFRDCKSYKLEDRLGDVLIEMYIAAERQKQQRHAREEAERKRKEEEARKEERRKQYNKEVDMTLALANEAEDYDTACKIRAYIAAYKEKQSETDISEWVAWASAKADWYDPTVSRNDELLGKRDHAENADRKQPKHLGYWW